MNRLLVCVTMAATLPVALPDNGSAAVAPLPRHFVTAHRGAGSFLAPENTAAAFDRGIKDPDAYQLEFDVQTLADGVGGIWHDETVDRISTSRGPVSSYRSASFKRITINAGSWFGGGVAAAHPLLLKEFMDRYGGRKPLLAHPKDTPATRLVIAEVRRRRLTGQVALQTFSRSDALLAKKAGLTAQLLIKSRAQASVDTPSVVRRAGIPRVSLAATVPDSTIASYVKAGLVVSCYGVNRHSRRDRLYQLGVRGIDTDDPAYISGDTARYHRTTDPFATQTWWYGHLGQSQSPTLLSTTGRGRFTEPDRWTIPRSTTPLFARQGWANPVPRTYTLNTRIRFDTLGTDKTRWAGIYFSAVKDHPYKDATADHSNSGYSLILRQDGRLQLYRKDPTGTALLKTLKTPKPKTGTETQLTIKVTTTEITIQRATTTATIKDNHYRGAYLYLGRSASTGHQGPGISFSHITFT